MIIVLKNFGRTPARKIQAFIQSFVSESLNTAREFTEADRIYLDVAAPEACRRAFTPLSFTKEQWDAEPTKAHAIIRVKYVYEDEGGNEYGELLEYYSSRTNMTRDEPRFYLLTDWTKEREGRKKAKQGDLFDLPRLKARAGGRTKTPTKATQKTGKGNKPDKPKEPPGK
ncbi:hypothetical protein [Sphingomonas sp.]|uniref:hypothetical protein n=1 Tax=Sphingomonas sp. TaxID=28214 RepID=UPI0017BEEE3F|nr:hypothetical protein [Sphingomonas sp.]MBA3512386.1 hypothetical protein [Sphingomonas sp.]